MLRTTKFDRQLWQLQSFETISYDKDEQLLLIHFLDETTLRFHPVSEDIVFQLILDQNKDSFIECRLKSNYSYAKVI
ncbi:KTSC domain-containing protein [Gracilibacillus halophilus]|nr:KTSC domain-containing protein [Gracilibacillus halophilus]